MAVVVSILIEHQGESVFSRTEIGHWRKRAGALFCPHRFESKGVARFLDAYLQAPRLEVNVATFQPRQANILDMHFKNGATDGVSLVAQNVCTALENEYGAGATGIVYHFAGASIPKQRKGVGTHESQSVRGLILEELGYQGDSTAERRRRMFPDSQFSALTMNSKEQVAEENALLGEIYNDATKIYFRVKNYLHENNIGTVVIRNIMSMALNPAATLGLYWLCEDNHLRGVQFLLMHHDLYNEPVRAHEYQTPYPRLKALIEMLYPPVFANRNVSHACLNTIAQKQLKEQKGIDAQLVPDLMDFSDCEHLRNRRFDTPLQSGEYNWRTFFDLSDQDLMVYVPTRVTDRKAISFAIQIVAEMEKRREDFIRLSKKHGGIGRFGRPFTAKSKIVLCLPQFEDASDNQKLINNLKHMALTYEVDIRFASDYITNKPTPPSSAFLEVYGQGDLPLYPSIQEGFGNQLLELLASGNPVFISKYPVLAGLLRYFTPDSFIAEYEEGANQRLDVLDKKGTFGGIMTNIGPLWYLQQEAVERVVRDLLELYQQSPEELRNKFWSRRLEVQAYFDLNAVASQFVAALPFGLRVDEN